MIDRIILPPLTGQLLVERERCALVSLAEAMRHYVTELGPASYEGAFLAELARELEARRPAPRLRLV